MYFVFLALILTIPYTYTLKQAKKLLNLSKISAKLKIIVWNEEKTKNLLNNNSLKARIQKILYQYKLLNLIQIQNRIFFF